MSNIPFHNSSETAHFSSYILQFPDYLTFVSSTEHWTFVLFFENYRKTRILTSSTLKSIVNVCSLTKMCNIVGWLSERQVYRSTLEFSMEGNQFRQVIQEHDKLIRDDNQKFCAKMN